jgi:ferredoxin
MLDKIKQKAKELLSSGDVKVVIGYGEGSGKRVRAVFIEKPEETDRLILDERCLQNLAVYLTKHEVRALGKPAIIARVPVMRTIERLSAEKQIAEGDIAVIGVTDKGEFLDFPDLKSMNEYISAIPFMLSPEEQAAVDKIEKMSMEERWNFWLEELSDCIKCYACRQSCPLCYCARCTVECNQPQWISVPSHKLGNLEWHVMRAMHLAGRCVNCGDCFRACPVNIPLNLLTQKIIVDIAKKFGVADEYALNTFKPDDTEDFIR